MKHRAKAGESIAETLVAVLIMSLVFLMLAAAVVTSARVNGSFKNEDAVFETDSVELIDDDFSVTISVDGVSGGIVSADLYRTANGYCYYE